MLNTIFKPENRKGAIICCVIAAVVFGAEQLIKSQREYNEPEWQLNTSAIKQAGEDKFVLTTRIAFVKKYRDLDEDADYYLFSDDGAIRIDGMYGKLAKLTRLKAMSHEGEVCQLELVKGIVEPWLVMGVSNCTASDSEA